MTNLYSDTDDMIKKIGKTIFFVYINFAIYICWSFFNSLTFICPDEIPHMVAFYQGLQCLL